MTTDSSVGYIYYILAAMMIILTIQLISIPFTLAYAKKISEQEVRSVLVPKRWGIILLMVLIMIPPLGYWVSLLHEMCKQV